jgi:hypothetical protein
MALLFSAWIASLVVLNRSFSLPVRRIHHVNAFAVIGLYFGGGIVAGTVLGLMRPLLRSVAGAMVTGFVAALPFFAGCSLLSHPLSQWGSTDTIVTLAASFILGPMTAVMIRAQADEAEHSRKSPRER